MTLRELIVQLTPAYDRSGVVRLTDYLDEQGRLVEPAGAAGDTLALFLVRELHSVFDPADPDNQAELEHALQVAIEQLQNVKARLESLAV